MEPGKTFHRYSCNLDCKLEFRRSFRESGPVFHSDTGGKMKWYLYVKYIPGGRFKLMIDKYDYTWRAIPVSRKISVMDKDKKQIYFCREKLTIEGNSAVGRIVQFPLKKSDISAQLPMDVTVSCTIVALEDAESSKESVIEDNVMIKNISSFYLIEEHADILLRIAEDGFPVHSFILVASSTVFSTMLKLDAKEKQSGVIEITDMASATAKELIRYMYTGKLLETADETLLKELLIASEKYGIPELKTLCENRLKTSERSLVEENDMIRKVSSYHLSKVHRDILFRTNGGDFSAHSFVLVASSPVFSAMLKLDTKERQSGIIEIPDMTYETLKELLRYMYTGELRYNLDESLLTNLLISSEKYCMPELKNVCERRLMTFVDTSTLPEYLIFSDLYSKVLKEFCLTYILYYSEQFTMSDQILKPLINLNPNLFYEVFNTLYM